MAGTSSTRQSARRAARERLKRAARTAATGLTLAPSETELLDLATLFAVALSRDGDATAVRRAARTAHQLNEASVRRTPSPLTLACRAGCAWCCHANRVAVTAPEAFLLAAAISSRAQGAETFRPAANRISGLDAAARLAGRLPCPLLADGRCSVYDVRPVTCRQTTALDVAGCIEEFEGRALDRDIETSPHHAVHAGHAQLLLLAGLAANGFPIVRYELNAAVLRILDTPDAERRWLGGENVFQGIEVIGEDDRVVEVARMLARRIGAVHA